MNRNNNNRNQNRYMRVFIDELTEFIELNNRLPSYSINEDEHIMANQQNLPRGTYSENANITDNSNDADNTEITQHTENTEHTENTQHTEITDYPAAIQHTEHTAENTANTDNRETVENTGILNNTANSNNAHISANERTRNIFMNILISRNPINDEMPELEIPNFNERNDPNVAMDNTSLLSEDEHNGNERVHNRNRMVSHLIPLINQRQNIGPHNSENSDNSDNSDNADESDNINNIDNIDNLNNLDNVDNVENVGNVGNVRNVGNVGNINNLSNTDNSVNDHVPDRNSNISGIRRPSLIRRIRPHLFPQHQNIPQNEENEIRPDIANVLDFHDINDANNNENESSLQLDDNLQPNPNVPHGGSSLFPSFYNSTLLNFCLTSNDNLLYDRCVMCNEKMKCPKIILHCQCQYHLECFLLLKNEEQCIECHDKIIKKVDSDYEKCSICLNLLKTNVEKIPCNHKFHTNCIRRWRLSMNGNNNKCPICRSCIY